MTGQVIPRLAVAGVCGLAASGAAALELGNIEVQSSLGQPLRASIAYALGPNEQIHDHCIFLQPGAADAGIPELTRARISVNGSAIVLVSQSSIREPILNLRLAVNCPYTPHLQREFTVMLDPGKIPAMRVPAPVAAALPARTEPAAAPAATRAARTTAVSVADTAPIAQGSRYRVSRGDTASTIVARVARGSMDLWPAVFALVDANPDAFVDGDINRLKAGSVIDIPVFDAAPGGVPAAVEPAKSPADTAATTVPDAAPAAAIAGETAAANLPAATLRFAGDAPEPASAGNSTEPATAPAATTGQDAPVDATGDLRPGDVLAIPAPPAAIADDSAAADPVLTGDRGRLPENAGPSGWSWFVWLSGAGVALFLGLLMFGRVIRERLAPVPADAAARSRRRRDDDPALVNPAIRELDFNFEDGVNARTMTLDADLEAGTGFGDGVDLDVVQDFGYSTDSIDLDLELNENDARESEFNPTDVIPPPARDDRSSILDAEVLPGDDTSDYDLSMIVDATKQRNFDVTAQDLHAVRIEPDKFTVEDDLLVTHADYQILEQDYEDELTATQALNLEIEKAARELAERMDEASPAATNDDTTSVDVDDIWLEAQDERDADLTAQLTANLPRDIDASDGEPANDTAQDTVGMVASGSGLTIEMQLESQRRDRKSRTKK